MVEKRDDTKKQKTNNKQQTEDKTIGNKYTGLETTTRRLKMTIVSRSAKQLPDSKHLIRRQSRRAVASTHTVMLEISACL